MRTVSRAPTAGDQPTAIANHANYRTAVERAAAVSDTAEGSEEACERNRLIKGMKAKRGDMPLRAYGPKSIDTPHCGGLAQRLAPELIDRAPYQVSFIKRDQCEAGDKVG